MLLTDVNILIYAADQSHSEHNTYSQWLDELRSGDELFGMSDLVLSGFLRIVTNKRIVRKAMDPAEALQFAVMLRQSPILRTNQSGPSPLGHFCRSLQANGGKDQ